MKNHVLSNFGFVLMSLEFRIRDWLRPPVRILQEAGIHSGMTVLDFGCGPGGFSMAAAELVGQEGLVYAVDIHPLALESVKKGSEKRGFSHVPTISGERLTDVPEGNVDIVLLFDVLHHLPEPGLTLRELHRILKPNGMLSVSDHHLKEAFLLSMVTSGDFFRFFKRRRWMLQFQKTHHSPGGSITDQNSERNNLEMDQIKPKKSLGAK